MFTERHDNPYAGQIGSQGFPIPPYSNTFQVTDAPQDFGIQSGWGNHPFPYMDFRGGPPRNQSELDAAGWPRTGGFYPVFLNGKPLPLNYDAPWNRNLHPLPGQPTTSPQLLGAFEPPQAQQSQQAQPLQQPGRLPARFPGPRPYLGPGAYGGEAASGTNYLVPLPRGLLRG
jgi:hypothetical protein